MPTKPRKGKTTLQDVLAGLQELLGWQAELIREGLRLVRAEAEPTDHIRQSAKRDPRSGGPTGKPT